MALVLKDRVKETTTTAGTGTVTLAGAAAGFQSFAAVGNGNQTFYAIVDAVSGDWEVGVGTYTASGTTLSRTTVVSSSNAGSLVPFGGGSKDVFGVEVVPVVDFLATAVQVAQHGGEKDPGGIDELLFRQVKGGADAEELAAYGAHFRVHVACVDKGLNKVGLQQDVGVQGQDPGPCGQFDSLILGSREPEVTVVVINPAAIRKLLKDVNRSIRRRVVYDNDFHVGVLLLQHGLQAALDKASAVVGDERD